MYKMCTCSLKSYKTSTHPPTSVPEKQKYGSHSEALLWGLRLRAPSHHTCSSPGNLYSGFCINHVLDLTILVIMYKHII